MENESTQTDDERLPKRRPRGALTLAQGGALRKPIPRRYRLTSLRAVRRELASVYWSAKDGTVELADATKLTFILGTLARVITDGDLEMRLDALEEMEALNERL
ncbi:MAG: hypothetical protein WCC11_03680 [Gammaproteobacteria bacterium]